MTSIITRRNLLGGLISAMAAPAIVRASSLMPVKVPKLPTPELVVYGRSPGMFDPEMFAELERAMERMRAQRADVLARWEELAVIIQRPPVSISHGAED